MEEQTQVQKKPKRSRYDRGLDEVFSGVVIFAPFWWVAAVLQGRSWVVETVWVMLGTVVLFFMVAIVSGISQNGETTEAKHRANLVAWISVFAGVSFFFWKWYSVFSLLPIAWILYNTYRIANAAPQSRESQVEEAFVEMDDVIQQTTSSDTRGEHEEISARSLPTELEALLAQARRDYTAMTEMFAEHTESTKDVHANALREVTEKLIAELPQKTRFVMKFLQQLDARSGQEMHAEAVRLQEQLRDSCNKIREAKEAAFLYVSALQSHNQSTIREQSERLRDLAAATREVEQVIKR